ncbi:uncharacterized protein GGS25DRAFT_192388 [Hypoxylon fragiforme]|uniref:uncharacterized protein n=1 Tax=Hypoxylon fragiforme TaxID=63214 RepID=UPI0020C67DEB|nr:uncharacterized protein GGS25DRAFT_192388 [Hypoxylon fragiforme]KAI2611353.1 hypothetical protein GGS25DRAFT_192388 [Hypoxylon fragiforme]
MSASPSPPNTAHLKATYTNAHPPSSSTEPFTLTTPLPQPSDPNSAAQKTSYLSALRDATTSLQESINAELTTRMEREAASAAATKTTAANSSKNGKKSVVFDDEAEEENYGEEVVEDDE